MELVFHKTTIDDVEELSNVLKQNQYRGCEWSIPNLVLWAEYYHMEYATVDHALIIKHSKEDGKIRLTFPVGLATEEAEREILELEIRYFRLIGQEPRLEQIDPVMWEKLERWYPGRFRIEWMRDNADYIYERERLVSLAGKKLHGKRNHINKFKQLYPDWSYESLSDENVEACFQMALKWRNFNGCNDDPEKNAEMCVSLNSLRLYKELGFKGGVLRNGEKIVAFTVGEELCKDTFVVHIEKAFADVQGAYPMINQQFVEHECMDYTYVNREDDAGEEGLRKAKLSYRPAFLEEKGFVTRIGGQQ